MVDIMVDLEDGSRVEASRDCWWLQREKRQDTFSAYTGRSRLVLDCM